MSPLRNIRSLKLKLGIVIVAAVIVAVAVTAFAHELGLTRRFGVVLAVLLALVVVQLLARGMTAPLREMAAAAAAMARGEHGQQVGVRGRDEVAQLAQAFNAMSAELAETDRERQQDGEDDAEPPGQAELMSKRRDGDRDDHRRHDHDPQLQLQRADVA